MLIGNKNSLWGKGKVALPYMHVVDWNGFTFARSSVATYESELNNLMDAAINERRIDYSLGYPDFLIEDSTTNYFINTSIPATQTITVTAQVYTVSFYGTGSIILSGAYSATLNGTGVQDLVQLTFTPTVGSLTLTLSGSVSHPQLENSYEATSRIRTTTTSVIRREDSAYDYDVSTLNLGTEGVFYFECKLINDNDTYTELSLSDGTYSNAIQFDFRKKTNQLGMYYFVDGTSYLGGAVSLFPYLRNKIAVRWAENNVSIWINGVISREILTTIPAMPNLLDRINFANALNGQKIHGRFNDMRLSETFLTDAQMELLTTL